MSITYSDSTIVVIGGSKQEPIEWDDVMAADVVGDWDILDDLGNGIWRLDANLQIGDGIRVTYFQQNELELVDMTGYDIEVKSGGHLLIGRTETAQDDDSGPSMIIYKGARTRSVPGLGRNKCKFMFFVQSFEASEWQ